MNYRTGFVSMLLSVVLCGASVKAVAQVSNPDLGALKLVTHLPPGLPQRVTGLAFDGEKLWATVYHGRGLYARLDPATLTWQSELQSDHYNVIAKVADKLRALGASALPTASYGSAAHMATLTVPSTREPGQLSSL